MLEENGKFMGNESICVIVQEDYPALRHLEEQWMVQLGSLGTLDPVQGLNKRDDAKAGARAWGT